MDSKPVQWITHQYQLHARPWRLAHSSTEAKRMMIYVKNAEEERSAWAALAVINSLREPRPIRPPVEDTIWAHTVWADERYL